MPTNKGRFVTALMNLLVVDAVAQDLSAIEALLGHRGWSVLKAASGAQALELLQANEVALVLLAPHLPHMDGYELPQRMRDHARTHAIPVLFMGPAECKPGACRPGQETVAEVLSSPIDAAALIAKVALFGQVYQLKQQLARQSEQLIDAQQLNSIFIAALGHDVRTPLSVVMNGAMLLPMMTDDPKVGTTATRIQASTRRMTHMVDQLLDLARLGCGKLHAAGHDYGLLCTALLDDLQGSERPLQIVMRSVGDVCGVVDGAMLSRVLSNLLNNAVAHGEPGAAVEVCIDGSVPDSIAISVSNRGVIAPQGLPNLFEPLRQCGDTGKAGLGLGLGLYTLKLFVKAHGGAVGVTSNPLQGTIFTVTMPRDLVQASRA